MKNKIIHTRLVRNSYPLFQMLTSLGFKEIESEGQGMQKIRKFQLGNKFVYSSTRTLALLVEKGVPKDKPKDMVIFDGKVVEYQGLTIHDKQLEFFAKPT